MFHSKLLAQFAALLFPFILFSQPERPNYGLLWEVSGNGLEAPSYLFGTMHVYDERAFAFSDSVLISLEAADAYAMEIHPDTVVQWILDYITAPDTSTQIREMMSEEGYARLDSLLNERYGDSLDSIERQDPMWVENILTDFEEPQYTNRKEQIVDMYLYRLARQQAKPIYGLEKMSDYDEVANSFFREIDLGARGLPASPEDAGHFDAYEQLISIYQDGDLEKARLFIDENAKPGDYAYEMIQQRNKNMARALEKLMAQQAVFCAVGAAHLPGEEGLIRLLEQAGYTLRKVTPTFTGVAEQYEEQLDTLPWKRYTDPVFGFSVELPGEPVIVPLPDAEPSSRMESRLYLDLASMTGYIFLRGIAYDLSEYDGDLARMTREFSGGTELEVIAQRALERDGVPGHEVSGMAQEGFMQWQFFLRGNLLYLFGAFREPFAQPGGASGRFFDSIRFLDIPPSEWSVQNNEAGAFSIRLPAEPDYLFEEAPYYFGWENEMDYHLHTYSGVDIQRRGYFMARYYNNPPGMAILDPDESLNADIQEYSDLWGEAISVDSFLVDGYPAREAWFHSGGSFVGGRFILRGNRVYELAVEFPDEFRDTVLAEEFFNSFRFLPLQRSEPEEIVNLEGQFRAMLPEQSRNWEESVLYQAYPMVKKHSFSHQDTLGGINYIVEKHFFSPYIELGDSLKDAEVKKYLEEKSAGDNNLAWAKDTTFLGKKAILRAREFPGIGIAEYSMLFWQERCLYDLCVSISDASQEDAFWPFFQSFEIQEDGPPPTPVSDYTALFFADLLSEDTLLRERAFQELGFFPIEKKSLPRLYEAIPALLVRDTTEDGATAGQLLDVFQTVRDENTLPFLEQLYGNAGATRQEQVSILRTLASIKEQESLQLFFRLAPALPVDTVQDYFYYNLLWPFTDTLELAASFIPEIVELRENENFKDFCYYLVSTLLRADTIDTRAVEPFRQGFIEDTRALLAGNGLLEPLDSMPEFEQYWQLDELAGILGELEYDAASDSLLRAIARLPDNYLAAKAAGYLLFNRQPVADSLLARLHEDHYNWYSLLAPLDGRMALEELPGAFFTHRSGARAYAHYILEDEYFGNITRWEWLPTQEYNYQGQLLTLHWFRFGLEEEDASYIGVCGIPAGESLVVANPPLFDYSYTEYSEDNLEDIRKEIMEYWEEED